MGTELSALWVLTHFSLPTPPLTTCVTYADCGTSQSHRLLLQSDITVAASVCGSEYHLRGCAQSIKGSARPRVQNYRNCWHLIFKSQTWVASHFSQLGRVQRRRLRPFLPFSRNSIARTFSRPLSFNAWETRKGGYTLDRNPKTSDVSSQHCVGLCEFAETFIHLRSVSWRTYGWFWNLLIHLFKPMPTLKNSAVSVLRSFALTSDFLSSHFYAVKSQTVWF